MLTNLQGIRPTAIAMRPSAVPAPTLGLTTPADCMGMVVQVATLEQQVANLERQRQQEGTSLRASSEHMQQEMQGHCTNLQAQLDAFQVQSAHV